MTIDALRSVLERLDVELIAVERDLRAPTTMFPPYKPPYAKLYCVYAGAGTHHVGGAAHRLRRGDLVFVPPDVEHVDNPLGARTYAKWFCHFRARSGGIDLAELLRAPTAVALGPRLGEALRLFADLAARFRSDRATDALRAAARFRELLALGLDAAPAHALELRLSPPLARVQRVVALLSRDLRAEHRLADLAAAAGVHPNHLCRVFTRALGMPPHQYLLRLRLARAQELLERSELTLAAIARRCGFADEQHLSHAYRAVSAIPPGQARRTARAAIAARLAPTRRGGSRSKR